MNLFYGIWLIIIDVIQEKNNNIFKAIISKFSLILEIFKRFLVDNMQISRLAVWLVHA